MRSHVFMDVDQATNQPTNQPTSDWKTAFIFKSIPTKQNLPRTPRALNSWKLDSCLLFGGH
jgi:hypothetical protein